MTDLDARITFLEDEIRKCKDMSSAASNLSGALSRIGEKFTSCSDSLSSGGFTIDGTGADTYTFGGYNQYVTTNITPIVNELDSICSTLAPAILKYDKELTDLISERNRLREAANEEPEAEEPEEKFKKPKPLPRILAE